MERLLQAITGGALRAGQKLPPERELAEYLGISRSTLRNALQELRSIGYLESRRGRYGGVFVRQQPVAQPGGRGVLDPGACADVLALRSVLEPGAAELAAGRELDSAARSHLLAYLERAEQADEGAYRAADAQLHVAIAELTASQSLVAAVTETRARVSGLLDCIPLLGPNITHSHRQHAAIVDAVLAGDGARARREMADHLAATAALLRGFLTDTKDAGAPAL
ncbi:FadR/GntR family transcriptional regulator [Micrococcus lacusdianchii]|uniref:FadR/GntR family transcriptional regulator n=1 Tax=Micrococcus lacusdianchii TaxID=2915940 RepID=UPI002004C4D9|nr:FCD domain-containing protein [Micrococcus sp. JXJ CY 30]